jgi:hypothetical protein
MRQRNLFDELCTNYRFRIIHLILIVLAILLPACKEAPSAQTTTISTTATPDVTVIMPSETPPSSQTGLWLRSTIEMLPESKKKLLIPYLDEAMGFADLSVQKFTGNDIDGLYNTFSPIVKDQMDINQFKQFINQAKNAYGEIESLEYRNQAFEYGLLTLEGEIDLTKANSCTYYAVTATKYTGNGLFLEIRVYRKDGQFGLTGLRFNSYGNDVPSWLQYPNAKVAPPY